MALYATGSPIANVTLNFTVDQWRVSFNQALADGVSTTADNTLQGTLTGKDAGFSGLVTAPRFTANTLTGTLSTAAQPNITSVGTLTSLSSTGPVTAPTFAANTLTGTISTASQPNITSVGTLTGLTTASATVTGNLTVDGDAVFNGNTTIVQSTIIETTDGLIHLAGNNEFSDTLDIGFFGHYNLTGVNSHAGFFRDSGTKEFYVFGRLDAVNGVDPEADININDATFELANVHMDVLKANTMTSNSLTLTTGATVTTILDEDTMSSDSATALATQQSIKAYVDGATAFTIVSSNTTLSAGNLVASNSAVAITLTLPATPSAGDSVTVSNQGTGTITVGRNGENIKSLAEDGTLNAGTSTQLVYIDSTIGWGEL